jgi:hypothetical protein
MKSELDLRIVTNAALNEIVGRYVSRHAYEMDVNRGLVLYHEGSQLLSREYQLRIVQSLGRVGYEARILVARHNPPPTDLVLHGQLVQVWPDRFTAVISIPKLKSNRDANIVEDAIAYARTRDVPASVASDREGGALTVSYSGQNTALRNIEHAIASSGFDANDTFAESDHIGEFAIGWAPIAVN